MRLEHYRPENYVSLIIYFFFNEEEKEEKLYLSRSFWEFEPK